MRAGWQRKVKVGVSPTAHASSTAEVAEDRALSLQRLREHLGACSRAVLGASPDARSSMLADLFLWRTHQVVVSRSATYTYTLHLALIPPSPIPGVSITVGGTLSLCGVFPRPAIHCGPSIAQIR